MKLNLKKEMFSDKEFLLAENGAMKAIAYCYSTGIEALRIENTKGNIVILPFHGQNVWDINFAGRDLKMKTTLKEPAPAKVLLDTYGGFLYHCGVGNVGAPDSTHPHHGEIHIMPYKTAYLACGKDENGRYMAVGGVLEYNVSFTRHYQFRPECRLYENGSVLKMHIELENMKNDAMEYAYLCHINFAPIDGAKLVYNAKMQTVHRGIPDSFTDEQKAQLAGYMDKLAADQTVGDTVGAPGQFYAPEICSTMIYDGDKGYTMQVVEGEGACYVCHPTKELPYGIRWISRTADEDAMGMVLPATCEHLGYEYAKANGQMKYLAGKETLEFDFEAGWIAPDKVEEIKAKINK